MTEILLYHICEHILKLQQLHQYCAEVEMRREDNREESGIDIHIYEFPHTYTFLYENI